MLANELMDVYSRISQRIKTGVESFESVFKILQKRLEAEEKFTQILKDLIPEKKDPDDIILNAIVEDIQVEINQHNRIIKDLTLLVVDPLKPFKKAQTENMKNIENLLNSQIKEVSKAIKELESSQKSLEGEQAKMSGIKPDKKDAQKKKIDKAAADVEEKKKKCDFIANKSQAESMPKLHQSFGDFDKSRLKKMQDNVLCYSQLKGRQCDANKESANRLTKKMNNFEASDRSKLIVNQMFDANSKPDDREMGTYAYAINDYQSEEPGDLQFERGDKIKVLLQHSSGWWDGEINGKKGFFPKSFVEVASSPEPKSIAIDTVLIVKYDFKPLRPEEIVLFVGDMIRVESVVGDKCLGTNLRTKQRGVFPLQKLDIPTPSN